MGISPRTASLALVTIGIAAACGGKVVIDGSGSSGGTSTGGTGGVPGSSSTVGMGAATTVGASSSGGFGGTPGSSAVSVGATSTSSSGGMDTCTPPPAAFSNPDFTEILTKCAVSNLTDSAGLYTCIETATGLVGDCLLCVDAYVQCAIENCEGPCIPPNTPSEQCVTCEAMHCSAQFFACSGLDVAPGSLTCAGVLGDGPTTTPWQTGLLPSDFTTPAGSQAYGAFDTCACDTVMAAGGCADLCNETYDGTTTPNYCNGAAASTPCDNCLAVTCGPQLMECEAN